MAKSLLELLGQMGGELGSGVLSDLEASAGIDEDTQSSTEQLRRWIAGGLATPLRAANYAAGDIFGLPITTAQPFYNPDFVQNESGVSESTYSRAAEDVMAQSAAKKMQMAQQAVDTKARKEQEDLNKMTFDLQKASSPGTQIFAAKGDTIAGDLEGKGSFSRTGMPLAEIETIKSQISEATRMPKVFVDAMVKKYGPQDAQLKAVDFLMQLAQEKAKNKETQQLSPLESMLIAAAGKNPDSLPALIKALNEMGLK